ncbi:hypothetical protein J1N35_007981 [Gossypium stocksii]|uniref:Uncharacterized protein n=1 Tax=Gossypium stocksii TaxID=47602 RepID=A0A9D3W9J2_9ROSI|nr:hypothetical protein J1N35_007981 [Gossypium stocksii]
MGSRWRVGSREKISITDDACIRGFDIHMEVWSKFILLHILNNLDLAFDQWLTRAFRVSSTPQQCLLCCALWVIWCDRNTRVHERKIVSEKAIARIFEKELGVLPGGECSVLCKKSFCCKEDKGTRLRKGELFWKSFRRKVLGKIEAFSENGTVWKWRVIDYC